MLLELAHWLAGDYRGFNVFNYITLRAVLATITALGISFVFGPAMIRWLTAKKSASRCVLTAHRRISSKLARRPWVVR